MELMFTFKSFGLNIGRSREDLLCMAVYCALYENDVPYLIEDIFDALGKEFTRPKQKLFNRYMCTFKGRGIDVKFLTTVDCMQIACKKLGLNVKNALELHERLNVKRGVAPRTLAGAIVYSLNDITQEEVGRALHSSAASMRKLLNAGGLKPTIQLVLDGT